MTEAGDERGIVSICMLIARRGVHRSTRELEDAINRYVESACAHSKPFAWTKTADEIQASMHRFFVRISNSGRQSIESYIDTIKKGINSPVPRRPCALSMPCGSAAAALPHPRKKGANTRNPNKINDFVSNKWA
ncbi:MAG: hypothetical protein OXP66_11265 [Candidatus Tectomicrobia bacterium]|nr:hypothetical protein [Candidatus Tectomicrobia bacterium]